jgi:acetyl esterase/lipase
MISLIGLLTLLSLPSRALITAFKTLIFGGQFRKYPRNVLVNVLLSMIKTLLQLPIKDCYYISYSNNFLLNRIVHLANKPITSKLPGYGTKNDANSLWLVKQPAIKKSDPILIYLHGGGYFLQTAPSQIESLIAIYKLTTPEIQSKLSMILLDYGLASAGHTVPHPLHQLHATYSRLVDQGFTNFVYVGDSAGGHLAITHLQYLKQVKYKVFPKQVVLISPWVKLSVPTSDLVPGYSYHDNDKRDIIQYKLGANVKYIVGNSDMNSLLISPGNKTPQDPNDWKGIPTLNDPGYGVFVLAGEDEVFRDDVLEWSKNALGVSFKDTVLGTSNNEFNESKHQYIRNDESSTKLNVYIEPWGVHDACLLVENRLLRTIKRNPQLTIKDVDSNKYFGISRIVKFLNESL